MFTNTFEKFINFEFDSVQENAHYLYELYRIVVWWQELENLENKLKIIVDNMDNNDWGGELGFLACTISLYCSNEKLSYFLVNKFKRCSKNKILLTALDIEICGRNGLFQKQAKIIDKALKKYSDQSNWIAYFTFISLSYPGANTKILLKSLDVNLSKISDTWLMLRARLLAGAGLIDISIQLLNAGINQWNGSGKLYWLRENIRGQSNMEPISDNEMIIVFSIMRKQLDMPILRYWFGIINSFGPEFRHKFIYGNLDDIFGLLSHSKRKSGEIASYILIGCWIDGNYELAHKILTKYHDFHLLPENNNDSSAQIFMRYILALLIYWQNNRTIFSKKDLTALAVGESHALSFANLLINSRLSESIDSEFIMGIRMHDFRADGFNVKKYLFEKIINRRNKHINLILAIGEIDCRPDGGIYKYFKKTGINISIIVNNTVIGYFSALDKILKDKDFGVIYIQGVPAPFHALKKLNNINDRLIYINMINLVNKLMKNESEYRGWRFIDIYGKTVNMDGASNEQWHIDGYHVQPGVYFSEELINYKSP